MRDLRPHLGTAVARLLQRSPYAAVLLSSREGTSIEVESKEEKINQLPLSAGIVLTTLADGVLTERSIPGFDLNRFERAVGEMHQALASA